ncbi:MAG: hypothetical protein WC788_00060 [Candidatus Paceibacterota bacterium]|jgi:Leucine-rich repeat (LRR) protein
MTKTSILLIAVAAILVVASAYLLGTMRTTPASIIPNIPGVGGAKEINLSGKDLTSIPKETLSQTQVTKLVLSNNKLRSLPSEIGGLSNIEELYLDHNELQGSLAGEIRKMSNLRILDVQYNSMTGIPAEIGQLKNLSTLNYSYNGLDTFPNEIANLKDNLKTLDISNNKYSLDSVNELKRLLPNTNIIY